jgi:dihydrofolate synthase/folylpolyglutamate synthase
VDDRSGTERLLALQSRGMRLGLERTNEALTRLGDPHRGIPWVIVAGTNGKGSTSAFLSRILVAAGYRVGLYTSPYLVEPRECVRVDDEQLPERDFDRTVREVLTLAGREEDGLTFFEALTCAAFRAFRERSIDVGVLEIGLGGAADAVNVVQPRVTVLTTIAVDHAEWLGASPAAIAMTESGLLRPRVPLATGVSDELFREVLGPICRERHIPVMKVGRDVLFEWSHGLFSYRGSRFRLSDVSLGLQGRYQAGNAAVAIATTELLASHGFSVQEDDVRTGLVAARWPGRFEIVQSEPPLVLDVAHNPDGAAALADSLRDYFGGRRFDVFVASHVDKDVAGILRAVVPVSDALTVLGLSRNGHAPALAIPADVREAVASVSTARDLDELVRLARAAHASGRPTLVTGSHRLVGAALERMAPTNGRVR